MKFDPMPLYWSLAIIMLIMAASFALTRYFTGRRENVLRAQIAKLYDKFGVPVPIDIAYQAMLVRRLTHFHTPVLDDLLARMLAGTLDVQGRIELFDALRERGRDMGTLIDDSERAAAKLLPLVMERVALEKGRPNAKFDVVLVKVPKAADDSG